MANDNRNRMQPVAKKDSNLQICPFCHKPDKYTWCVEKRGRIYWICGNCYKKETD